ncbi:MAG: CPBP family intramembrane metalloprotease [bacterium]|nr:CPBP family intramembrane metalloprotease [bacterium]
MCEELVFRGVVFGALWRSLALWPAVLLSALVFAIVRMELAHLLRIAIIGVVCALSYARMQSLMVPIGTHVVNNMAAFAYVALLLWEMG